MEVGAMVLVLQPEYSEGAIKIKGRVLSSQMGIVKSRKVKTGCSDDTECKVLLGNGKIEIIAEGNLWSGPVLSIDQQRLWDPQKAFGEFATVALLEEIVKNLSKSKKRFLSRQLEETSG
jgi:hypothetical protein